MKYIKGFDALRAISIILVLLTHLGLYHHLPENDFIKYRVWQLISGNTGVQIFFTLSGFLITKILLEELNEFKSILFKQFYIRRFLKLLPPLLVFYIVVAILMQFGLIDASKVGFLYSFFYLYNFVPNQFYTGELAHTWSLAIEEQYYIIWPFVINFLSKKKGFLFIFFILIACIISINIYPYFSFTGNFKPERWFIPAVGPILIGSFFAWLIDQNERKFGAYFEQKQLPLWIGIIMFALPLYTPIMKLSFLFQSIGISIILIWILFNQESRVIKILNIKAITYIGTISYGLYVYQGLFLKTGPSGTLWFQKFPQNIVLTFLTAIISFHLLEKPILKLKKKFQRSITN